MECQYKGRQYSAAFTEKDDIVSDDTGFKMNLKEISLGEVGMRWGEYVNPTERLMTFHSDKEHVVSHFQMYGSDVSSEKTGLLEKQFVVYRESIQPYDLCMAPTNKSSRSFFELIMSNHFFNNLISEESIFLKYFDSYKPVNTFSPEFIAQITPRMYAVISEMHNAPYRGNLKGLFLEAKLLELFLMQIYQLDNRILLSPKIKTGDIERLQYIKAYLDCHFAESLSIIMLSREAGINQTKLKNGFKELFKTTVFGYINELRLKEAKRLLLEEKMCVNEVAYTVGYKYPHYFSAAFKKKFGILPASLRS
jgi:AraC-like DNA-binding protein